VPPRPRTTAQPSRSSSFQHRPSHRRLVTAASDLLCTPGVEEGLDVIAVPAARDAGNLRHAAEVAAEAGSVLLVLCSKDADPGEAYDVVTGGSAPPAVVVLGVPHGYSLPGLQLEADRSSLVARRTSDTHLKRNLAIAVAHRMGWSRLLFLDDDVRGFGNKELDLVRAVLADRPAGPKAVGWAFDDFPDNSIVCHAHRLAGGPQKTFIGGGALAIRVSDDTPHFPRMYNEDWLFMLPLMLRGRRELVLAGTMQQMEYDPFASPEDADRQEAGDVLAEALFSLLHDDTPWEEAWSQQYWRDVLTSRRRFIQRIKAALSRRSDAGAARACAALDRALLMGHTSTSWPGALAKWVQSWERDTEVWSRWLAGLTPAVSIEQAVDEFGLDLDAYVTPAELVGAGASSAG